MSSSSKVLALKYRPQTFSDLIGQDIMVETITNSIKSNKIPNAYLFTGIRGVGKTTTARIVAKSINCKNGIDKICKDNNKCDHCEAITNSNHLDCIEHDASSKSGVDDIREILDFCRFPPSTAKYKIIILDEIQMLSKAAFNALLKTIEEPPKYLLWIFATTEVRKIPVTIISRCQRFDLKRIKPQLLFNYLKKIILNEKGSISDEALKLIVKISEGSVRDGLSLLDRALISQKIENKEIDLNMVQKIFGYFDKYHIIEILNLIFQGEEKQVIQKYRNISDQGVEPKIFLNDFIEILYFIKNCKIFGPNEINFSLNDTEAKEIEKISHQIDNQTLITFWQFTIKQTEEINIVANQNLSIEMFLIRLIYLTQIPNLEELLNDFSHKKDNFKYDKNPGEKILETQLLDKEEIQNTPKSFDQIKNIAQEKEEEILKSQNNKDKSFSQNIINIDELIEICSKKKELKLKFDLENNVRLVKFENGLIEIEFNENLDKDFVKNLSHKLFDWSGKRWIILLSKEKGKETKKENIYKVREKKIENIKKSEIYKKMIENFSDAELIDIDDKF